ncbi:MAG: DUF2061 domain-containing protein [Lutibacter sp.]|nr:DUF2061 domain-containing protein [Lutibacter sp.]
MIFDKFFNSNKKNTKEGFNSDKKSEKPMRSVVKSISWRLVGTMDTIIISWVVTGKVALALTIGSIELATKMVLYFFHERIWNTIKWGK